MYGADNASSLSRASFFTESAGLHGDCHCVPFAGNGREHRHITVVNAVLLRALPVTDPEQLFELTRSNAQKPIATSFNYLFYRQLLNRNNLLEGCSARADLHVAGFTFASYLVTGFLFSFAPALQFWKSEPGYRLNGETASVPGTRIRWRKLLAGAQVAISFLLLIAAGLFLRSLQHLRDVHPGFDGHNVLAVSIDPTSNGYKQDQARAFYRKVAERVSQLPGVLAVSFARVGLIESFTWRSGVIIEGSQTRDGDAEPFWEHSRS
jgi:hypothetical protein